MNATIPARRFSDRTIRLALGFGVPLLAATVALGPIIAWGSSLPRRVATHWGATGPADGFMSRGAAYAVIAGLLAVGTIVLAVAATRRQPTMATAVGSGVVGGLLCGIAAASSIAIVSANRHVTASSARPTLSALLLVASVTSLVVFVLATGLLASSLAVGHPLPAAATELPVRAGERVAWTGTSRPRPIMWIVTGALVVATIAVGLITGRWGVTVIATIGSVVSLVMTGNRVTVGPSGLRASMGAFGLPRVNVPIDKIVQASALDVRPMKWGGWGYRGSLKVMKRAAMVVRAGDGIRLDLVGGLVLVVTVDDAATGAAVLQTAIASRPAAI
jgi:Protein of unknown function (DUF1648)